MSLCVLEQGSSAQKLLFSDLLALCAAGAVRMDKLVLQAVEEVALEGPEGRNSWSPHDTQNYLRTERIESFHVQAVPPISFGTC